MSTFTHICQLIETWKHGMRDDDVTNDNRNVPSK